MRWVRFARGKLRSLRLRSAAGMGRLSFRSLNAGLILGEERGPGIPRIG